MACLVAGLLAVSAHVRADEIRLAQFQAVDQRAFDYYRQMLALALGPQTRVLLSPPMAPERMFVETGKAAGGAEVMVWACSGAPAGTRLRRVNFLIDRGAGDYWVLAVRRDHVSSYASVRQASELRGKLYATGFPVRQRDEPAFGGAVGLASVPNLKAALAMTEHGRIDGVLLVARLAEQLQLERGLPGNVVIEPSLLLHYPSSSCFYVAERDVALADRIGAGLAQAQRSGEAMKLANSAGLARFVETLKLRERRVIDLPHSVVWAPRWVAPTKGWQVELPGVTTHPWRSVPDDAAGADTKVRPKTP
ncbi:hypothetical protein ACTSKR_10145 [Chitinibacteraceae bacterium HSL-7]